MKKTIRTALYSLLVVLVLQGCASNEPPTALLNEANDALSDASKAEECAKETFRLAQNALAEAKAAAEKGDNDTARLKARLAANLAKQAKEEAVANAEDCERRRQQAQVVSAKLEPEAAPVTATNESYRFEVIYFDFDEAVFSAQANQHLMHNVEILKRHPNIQVRLTAHTDDRGSTEYNIALSQKRGEAVKHYVSTLGVEDSRMMVVPYGKEMPASLGSREQDHALNRRVEFIER